MPTKSKPLCESCGQEATCYGEYDDLPASYACDDCCGHGVFGRCVQWLNRMHPEDNMSNDDRKPSDTDLAVCEDRLLTAKSQLVSAMKRLGIYNSAYPDMEKAEEAVLDALQDIHSQRKGGNEG